MGECGQDEQALPFIRRSLYLVRLIGGPIDPLIPVTLSNMAMILRSLGDLNGGIRALSLSLELYDLHQNLPMQIHTCRQLSTLFSEAGRVKEALAFEKRYNKVVSQYYPKDDSKVIESNELLSKLTGLAVRDAKDRIEAARASAPSANSKQQKAAAAAAAAEKKKSGRSPMSVLPKPGQN